MRRLLLLLSLLFSGFCLAEQGYYPHADGLSWTYSNGETQTLSGPREIDGQQVMALTHYIQGTAVSEDYLIYGEDGVFLIGTAAGGGILSYDPPLSVYAGSKLQVGQSWKSTTRVGELEITLTAQVLGIQGVKNEAGRFNALHIRQTTVTNTGAQTPLDLFFVPGVGVVRWLTQDGTVVELIDKNF